MQYQTTTVRLPRELHKRAKKLAERLATSVSGLLAEALLDKVVSLEAKLRTDAASRVADEAEHKKQRREAFGAADPASLAPAPLAPNESATEIDPVDAEREAAMDEAFAPLAAAIAEVSGAERRLAELDAVRAIRRRMSISAPPDHEIVARLRRLAARVPPPGRPSGEPKIGVTDRLESKIVNVEPPRIIDTSKLRTFGAPEGEQAEPHETETEKDREES